MDELETDSSTTTDDAPLTMSEAVKALTATEPEEEAEPGQSDPDEAQEETADEDQPDDEEGEDEEGADADEEQAEEDEEDEEDESPESDQGRFVSDTGKVRLDDGTIVSIADLKKGTLLHADYTRKTQEVAEQRRAVETQSAQTQQQQLQLAEQREYVTSLIQSIIPEMPGPELLAKDPQGYLEQRAAAEQWQQHLQHLSEQSQRDAQARQAEAEQATKKRLHKEWTTAIDKLPELADPKRLEAFGKDTQKYGAAYGYSPEEISRIHYDHRQLLVFKDAIEMRKLREKQKAAKGSAPSAPERPPVMKGGKRLNPKAERARAANAAMERLNKTGSLKDGVAALLATQKKKG